MKALTWHGKRDVRIEDVPDPVLQDPTDGKQDDCTKVVLHP